MDPVIPAGARQVFTPLDFAALQDIGWQVAPPNTIVVQPAAGLTTTKAGGAAVFTVVLTTPPTDTVTLALSSSNPAAGTLSTAQLTFTPDNALVPQTVVVYGHDDGVPGDTPFTIVTAPAVSNDPHYNGQNPADVSVTDVRPAAPPGTVPPGQPPRTGRKGHHPKAHHPKVHHAKVHHPKRHHAKGHHAK
jgi:hypothetical protein